MINKKELDMETIKQAIEYYNASYASQKETVEKYNISMSTFKYYYYKYNKKQMSNCDKKYFTEPLKTEKRKIKTYVSKHVSFTIDPNNDINEYVMVKYMNFHFGNDWYLRYDSG